MISKKKMLILILALLSQIIMFNGLIINTSGSYIDEYSYYKEITLTESNGDTLTDFQVPIVVYYGSGSDGTESINSDTMIKIYLNSHSQTDFDDVRFSSSDDNELDYWIQEKDDSNYAIFWVEIDTITANDDTMFHIYYGNATTTTTSNGVNTFPLFDHFDDTSLNATLWNTVGTPSESGTIISLNDADTISSKISFGFGYAVYSSSIADEQDTTFLSFDEGYPLNILRLQNSDLYSNNDFDKFQMVIREDGSSADTGQDGWNDFRSDYNVYSIRREDGTFVTFTQSDNSYKVITPYIPNGNCYAYVGVYDSSQESQLDVDWIFVRKWIEDQPASSVGNEQTSIIIINSPYGLYGFGYNGTTIISQYVDLGWIINETDCNFTEILRSINGVDYISVGNTSFNNYRDENVSKGYYYYYKIRNGRFYNPNSVVFSDNSSVNYERVYWDINNTGYWNIWVPSNLTVSLGTVSGGNLASIQIINDDSYLEVSEIVGTPAYVIEYNWTDIPDNIILMSVNMNETYDGNRGHIVLIQIYCNVENTWKEIGEIFDSSDYAWNNNTIECSLAKIRLSDNNGTIMGRVIHTSSGNINHDQFIDYIELRAFIPSPSSDGGTTTEFLWYPIFFYVISIIFIITVGISLKKKR